MAGILASLLKNPHGWGPSGPSLDPALDAPVQPGDETWRAQMLPFKTTAGDFPSQQGIPGFGVPQLALDVWEAMQTPGRIMSGEAIPGDELERSAALVAGGMMGGGGLAAGGRLAALGANASKKGGALAAALDMSPAARKARADAVYRPETVYHGTDADFAEFDLSKGGLRSQSRAGQEGVSVSPSASVANEFAADASTAFADGSRILPLRYRSSRQARLTLDGTEKNTEVAATLADAWEKGFDSVQLHNYTTPSGKTGQKVIIVRNPNQLRSVNAAFDPAKADSANLLAANASKGAGAFAAATQDQPAKMTDILKRGTK